MSVDELNQDQLEELRANYFIQLQETSGDDVLQGITSPQEIEMSNVKAHYEDTYFVNDDFFCSAEH